MNAVVAQYFESIPTMKERLPVRDKTMVEGDEVKLNTANGLGFWALSFEDRKPVGCYPCRF